MGLRAIRAMRLTANELKDQLAGVSEKTQQINRSTLEVADKTDSKAASRSAEQNASKKEMLARDLQVARIKQTVGAIQMVAGAVGTVVSGYKADLTQKMEDLDKEIEADLLDKLADQLGIERTAANMEALKGLSNDDLNRLANGSSEDMAEVLKGVDLGPETVQLEGGSFLDFLEQLLTGSSGESTTEKPKAADDPEAADDGTDVMMPEVVVLPPEQRREEEAATPEQTLTTPPVEAPAKKVDVVSPDDASKGKATPAAGSATHQDHQDRVKAVRGAAEQLLQARQAAGFQKTWISETLRHAQRFGPGNASLLGEGGLLTKGLLKATVFKLGDPTLVAKYLNENFAGPARGQHQERRQERVDLEKQRDKQRHDQVTAISNLEQATGVTFTDEERVVLNEGGQAARELLLTKGALQLDGEGKLAKGPALDAFMALEKANGKIEQLDRRIERAKVKEAAAWSNLAKELADVEHFLDLADDKAAKGGRGSQKLNDMRREMRASLDQDLARLERDQQDLLGAGSAEQGVTERDAKRQAKIADDLASGWRTLFNRRQETAKEVDDGRLRSAIETRTLEAGENALSLQAFAVDAKDRANSRDPFFLAGVGGDRGVRQLADRVEKEANRQLAQPVQDLDKGKGREALQQTMDEALKGNVMAQVQWRTLAFGDKAAVEAVVGKKLNDKQFAQVQAAAKETLGRVATGTARDMGALLGREVSATELTGFRETAKQIEDRHFAAKVTALAESVEAVEAFVDNETTLGQTDLTKVIAAATQGDAKALDKWHQLAFGDKAAVEKVVGRSLSDDQVAEVQRTARNALQLVVFGNQADVKQFLGKDAENLKAVRQMAQKGYAAQPELDGNAGSAQWQRPAGREGSRQADALDRVKTIREAVQRDQDHHWQIGASFQNSDGVTLAEAKDYLTMIQREMIRYNGRVAAVGQKADNKEMLMHLHNLRRMAQDQNLDADALKVIDRAIANVEARRFLDTRGLTRAIDPQALKSFETQLLVATKSREEVESHLHETGRLADDQQLSQGDYESMQKQARAELGLEQASSQMIQAFQSREEVQKHLREIGDLESDQVLSQADYTRRQEQALATLTRLAKQNWAEQELLSMAAGGRTAMDAALGKPLSGAEYNELEAHLKRILANRFLDRTEHLQLIQLAYGTNVESEAGETLNTTDLGKGQDLARRLLNQETVDEGLLEAIVDGNQAEVGKQLGLGAKATEVLLRIVRPEAERAKTEMDRLSSGDIAAKLYGLFGATPQLAKRQIDKGLAEFGKLGLAQQNALLNQLAQTRRGNGTALDYMLSQMTTEQLANLRSIDRFAADLAVKLDLGTAMGIDRALAARSPQLSSGAPPHGPSQPPTAFQQAITAQLGITDKAAAAQYAEVANLLIEGKQAEAGARLADMLEMDLEANQKAALLANLASDPLLRDAQGKSGLQRVMQTQGREDFSRLLQAMKRDGIELDLATAGQVADEWQRRGGTNTDLRDWVEGQLTNALIRQSKGQQQVSLVTDAAKVHLLERSLSSMIANKDLGNRSRGRYAVDMLAGADLATQAAVLNKLAASDELVGMLDQLQGADRERLLKLAAANHGLSKKAAEVLKAGAGDKASIHLRSQLQQRIDQGSESGAVQVAKADESAMSRSKVQALAREIIRRSQWGQLGDLKDFQAQFAALTADEMAEVLNGLASVAADAQTTVLGKWLAKLDGQALEAMVDKLAGSQLTLSANAATLLGQAYGGRVGQDGRHDRQEVLVGLMAKALAAMPATDTPVDDQKVSAAVDIIKAQLAQGSKAADIEQALRLLSAAERAAVFNALADSQDADGNDLLGQLLGQDDDRMRDRFVLLLADTRGLSEKATAVLETNAKPALPDDVLLKAKVQARRLELSQPPVTTPAPTTTPPTGDDVGDDVLGYGDQMPVLPSEMLDQISNIEDAGTRDERVRADVRAWLERRGVTAEQLDELTDKYTAELLQQLATPAASSTTPQDLQNRYGRTFTEVMTAGAAKDLAGSLAKTASDQERLDVIKADLMRFGIQAADADRIAQAIVAGLAEHQATGQQLDRQYKALFSSAVAAYELASLGAIQHRLDGMGQQMAQLQQAWDAKLQTVARTLGMADDALQVQVQSAEGRQQLLAQAKVLEESGDAAGAGLLMGLVQDAERQQQTIAEHSAWVQAAQQQVASQMKGAIAAEQVVDEQATADELNNAAVKAGAKAGARRPESGQPPVTTPPAGGDLVVDNVNDFQRYSDHLQVSVNEMLDQVSNIEDASDRQERVRADVRAWLERRGVTADKLDELTDKYTAELLQQLDAPDPTSRRGGTGPLEPEDLQSRYTRTFTRVMMTGVANDAASSLAKATTDQERLDLVKADLIRFGIKADDADRIAQAIVAELAEHQASGKKLDRQYKALFSSAVVAYELAGFEAIQQALDGMSQRMAQFQQSWDRKLQTAVGSLGLGGQNLQLASDALQTKLLTAEGRQEILAQVEALEKAGNTAGANLLKELVQDAERYQQMASENSSWVQVAQQQVTKQREGAIVAEQVVDKQAASAGVNNAKVKAEAKDAGRRRVAELIGQQLFNWLMSAPSLPFASSLSSIFGGKSDNQELEQDYEKLRTELVELIESERERIEEADDKAYLAMVTAQMEESAVVLLEARGLLSMAAQSGDDAKLKEARGVMQRAMTHYQNARITFESALAPGGGTDEEGGEARDAVLAKLDTSLIKQADALLISGKDMVLAADRLLSGDAAGRVADMMLLTGGKTPESIVKAMSVGDVVRQRLRKWEEIANKTSHANGVSGETGVVVDADDHQIGMGDAPEEGGDGSTDDDRRAELARQVRHAERQLSEGVAQDQAEALQVLQDALVAETIDGETFTNRLTEQDLATVLTVLGQGGTLDPRLLGRLQVALSEMRVKLGGSKADGMPRPAATEPAGTGQGSGATDIAADDHGGMPSGQVGSTSGPSEGIVNVESPAVTTAVGRSAAEQPHAGAGSTRLSSVAQADGAIKDRQSVRATYDKAAEAYLVAADQLETLRADYLGKLQTMLEARQALTEARTSGRGVAVAEAAFRQASAAVETARTATLAQAGQLAELADRLSAVRATLAGETDVSGQTKVQSREQITSLVQGAERDLVRFAADGAQSPLSVQELLLGQQLIMEGELALLQRERAADGRFAQLAGDLDARRTANRQQAERLANVIQLEQQMAPAAGLAERRSELQQAYAEINEAIDGDRQALHGINAHLSARTAEQGKLAERQAQWRTLNGLLEMAERAPAQADRARLTQAYEALAATVAADGSQAEQQALAAARPHLQRLLGSADQASEADRDGLIQRQNLPAVKSAAAEVLTAFQGQDTDRQSAVITADIAAKTADGERLNGQIATRQATRSDVWQQLQQVNRQAAAQPTEQGTLDADLALVTDLTTVPSAYGQADFEVNDPADREAVLTTAIGQNQQRLLTVEQANLQATGSRQDRLASARTIDGVRRDIAAQRNEGEQREHQYARRNAINEAVDQVWVAKENLRLATNAGADPATLARLQAQVDDANRQLKEVRYGQRELGTSSDRERQWQAGQKRADGIAGFMATTVSSTLGGFRTLLSGSEYGFQRHLMNIVEGLEKINQARAEYKALQEALMLAMKEEKRLAAEMMLLGIEQDDATGGHGK